MNRIIEVTTDLNIDNTKLVLDGLAKCRGIGNYHVYIHVDDGCPGMLDMLRNHSLRHVRLLKAFRIGRDCNVYAAMEHGFQCADYVIHLDDTAIPHPRFLEYHEYCQHYYDADLCIVSIAAHSYPRNSGSDDGDEISDIRHYHRDSFDPAGFGTWKRCWKGFFQKKWNHPEAKSWSESIDRAMGWKNQIVPEVSFCDLIASKAAVAA